MTEKIGAKLPLFDRISHWFFDVGIILKGLDALLEVAGGVIFLLASNITLNRIIISLTQHELVEDPQDQIANLLRAAVLQLTPDTRVFGSAYLVVHGFVKLWLIVGLFRSKLWAYPTSIGFLCLFIAYQVYRLSYQFSIGLLLLTMFDSIFVFLILREYKSQKASIK